MDLILDIIDKYKEHYSDGDYIVIMSELKKFFETNQLQSKALDLAERYISILEARTKNYQDKLIHISEVSTVVL